MALLEGLSAGFASYLAAPTVRPLFIQGDALSVLADFPDQSIHCVVTSPPYWNKRDYAGGGIGQEDDYLSYVAYLLEVGKQIKRVLTEDGSLWLNLGDTYVRKGLVGLPWRVALSLIDAQGWLLRNDIIWNKLKGPDNAKDKLRNTHEYIFHFVKREKGFYYDVDAIRSSPRRSYVRGGAVVSATGITGVRYKRQIELSTALTDAEKSDAYAALDAALERIAQGELHDFRMVIRNQQRTTHSNSSSVSGRAKELMEKGFYFLFYHPDGSKPGDVWEIMPEDSVGRGAHYAAFPEDLCRLPILATCPQDGIVLDPFCGTGTTNLVALHLERKSVGIDISQEYLAYAEERCFRLL